MLGGSHPVATRAVRGGHLKAEEVRWVDNAGAIRIGSEFKLERDGVTRFIRNQGLSHVKPETGGQDVQT